MNNTIDLDELKTHHEDAWSDIQGLFMMLDIDEDSDILTIHKLLGSVKINCLFPAHKTKFDMDNLRSLALTKNLLWVLPHQLENTLEFSFSLK